MSRADQSLVNAYRKVADHVEKLNLGTAILDRTKSFIKLVSCSVGEPN